MKYKNLGQNIPQEARKELNEKILHLIACNQAAANGITPEDIYNAYTGDGGLHGLNFSDFDNYAEFSSAKKEIENGQFFTSHPICEFVMAALAMNKQELVADLTCGMGNFFNFVPVESNAYGCEIDAKAYKVAHYLYPAANLVRDDIRSYSIPLKMDYVAGNPPFNLTFELGQERILSQLYFCQKAVQLLKPYGIMAIVVPMSFLADDFSDGKMIEGMEQNFRFLGQFALPTDAFRAVGVQSYPTKVQFWQKRPEGEESKSFPYHTAMTLDVANFSSESVEAVRKMIVVDAQTELRTKKSSIMLQLARESDAQTDFAYKVKKYLYTIKSHPRLQEKYGKACEYLGRLYDQKQPEGMSYEEWCRVRITEAKVLAYLRQIVSRQHKPKYEDKIELVKSNGCLTYRAYSPKMARKLTESQKEMVPISSIIAYDWPAENYGVFSKMLRRKQRCYQTEMQPFSEMSSEPHIAEWLNDFILHDAENNEDIHLTDLQKQDINRLIQKQYGLIQWEQGSGKTLAGIAVGTYRMQEQNAFCTWVISPAISIKNTWEVAMQNYGKPYIMLTRSSDLDNIQQGDFVLVTLNMLCKYRKQIKKWIRLHNQKVAFCFDESDEMSNPNSRRTKAALSCFRRCKFKLLMTGTTTRNNISEFAPQLEMLYNNSYNMMSWSQTVYHFNRGKKDEEPGLQEDRNLYFGKPIPAYKAGYSLFSASHLPEKVTVFGVGQKTQDIYNADELNDILAHTVITRTFEEITGKDIKHIHQIPVQFSFAEKAVYQKAINEFHSMRANYFRSTGNARKDSMMRLIQQITLLLRISAAPNTVKEYTGGMPVKLAKVMEMLQDMPDDMVAIGVRHKNVVDAYAAAIHSVMPDRPLFVVTGDTTTIAQRRKLRQTLKESGNGILLCTQQSLPSSVNFEYVDKVIIPELHYNNSRMSQFYMRFVRFTSQHEKDIYFVTYLGSIESNQMQMVLAKEKINLFMRGKETDLDEIYDTFGVDYNLLEALMRREEDKDGHFQIHWGQQEIS